jgi:hypothetical protein
MPGSAFRLCSAVIWTLLSAVDLLAATRVELVIDELRSKRSVAWPITTGVPFPEGLLARAEHCRLIDDRGVEQLLQTKVAATWDAARSSIRWLTIDFIAQPGRKYALEFGPEITRKTFPPRLVVRDGDVVAVETGAARFEFARRGPAAFRSVRIDLDGDGQHENDEPIAGGARDGDHVYVDQAGQRATGAGDGDTREIVVESNGPVRSCVRVDGWYTGPDGRRIVRYRTRYHAFSGLGLIKVIDEFRIVGSTRDTQFRDIALPLELRLDTASRRVVTPVSAEQPDQTSVTPWQPGTRAISLVQETYRHFGNPECRAYIVEQRDAEKRKSHESERAGSWLQVVDQRAAVTGSLRWLWQQFPKQWEVTGDRVALHLWSPEAGVLDFGETGLRQFFGPAGHKYLLDWEGVRKPQSPIENFFFFAGRHALQRDGADGLGLNKHHEVWFHFAPASAANEGQEYGDLADRQPLCLASGEWNCSTGVFGPLAARPNASPYEKIVDRIFDLERYAQDAFGDYGWWLFGAGPHYSYQWDATTGKHYADPRRFEYHTYQRETQLWWSYLRSGERKFFDWAIPSENHWVDVAVAHAPTKFSTEWRGGTPGEATLHFPAGDWSIDSPLHYVRHHDTGEAWLRSASQFWASYHRTLETTTLAYYLTGDERYQDVVNFWRDYWGALAGVTSDSTEVQPWHREQLWFQPTPAGQPAKSWARMLRDYAPFQSGSRHQMTLFFNLSTLYEHTWDPTIRQALSEYADAFIDPAQPNGVWQCQDHRLPANADSPLLAHYWSPALWKYSRASRDPRMPEILRKYFTACVDADPYGEDVGIYSNVQIAWAWHFTRDPRHLIAARHELAELLPSAEPLAKPEDLGVRIYNPYQPIRALTATPRLIAVLDDAARAGVPIPPPPVLAPQRTLIAIERQGDEPIRGVLWGWDARPAIVGTQSEPAGSIIATATHRSHRQPFDRVLPGHHVYRHEFTRPHSKSSDGGWCYVSPSVELGVLELHGAASLWCWAQEPVRIESGERWWWRRTAATAELTIESAQVSQLSVSHAGQPLAGKIAKNTLTVTLGEFPADALLTIETRSSQPIWFRLSRVEDVAAWVTPSEPRSVRVPPVPTKITAARRPAEIDPRQTFVPGRFGEGLLVVPGRELQIPDELTTADGSSRRLSDQRQGTIEFWIRRLWDERLVNQPTVTIMNSGSLQAWSPWQLPLGEWSHVAVVWRPIKELPDRSLVHVYVDGRDFGNYRSLYWAGYSHPPTFSFTGEWLKKFVVRAPPGVMFVLDDIRISTAPRYVNLSHEFGRQQTFNPDQFQPSTKPASFDNSTVLLLPLDGNTRGTTVDRREIEATLIGERR